ncbi:unnamed protein product [Arctogadus glacialis]
MEDKLIIAVGSRPILYDQSMYTYMDTTLKDRAWQDVSLERDHLQHRNPSPVSVVAVTEEHGGGSREEAGALSPPALAAAMADEAATAPATAPAADLWVGASGVCSPQKRAGVERDVGLRCPLLSRPCLR